METFDKIQTSVFGNELTITAESQLKNEQTGSCEVQVKIAYQSGVYTFPANGPITHLLYHDTQAVDFPREQISAELQTVEQLFLDYYSHKHSPIQIVGEVLIAYRQLGPELTITPSKIKQDVTDGNS